MKYTHSLGISTSRFPVHFWFEEDNLSWTDGRRGGNGTGWTASGGVQVAVYAVSILFHAIYSLLWHFCCIYPRKLPYSLESIFLCVVCGPYLDSRVCLRQETFLCFLCYSFSASFPNYSVLTLLSPTLPLLYSLCGTVSADPPNKSSWVHVMHRQTRDRGTLNHYPGGLGRL